MNAFLERLGRACARWHWAVVAGWIVIVGGLLLARQAFGGDFSDDYSVPGVAGRARHALVGLP